MVKNILLGLLGLMVMAVVVIALIASQRPDTFRVSRSAIIVAPADRLFSMINNLRELDTWNPYRQKDPQMKSVYSGPASGPGARSDFESKKAGSGNLEIVQATASLEVKMRLNMTAPMKADNAITFTLAPQDNATQASWSMEGPVPFIAKCMGVVFNMDKLVGVDFEAGLANLKARAEKA